MNDDTNHDALVTALCAAAADLINAPARRPAPGQTKLCRLRRAYDDAWRKCERAGVDHDGMLGVEARMHACGAVNIRAFAKANEGRASVLSQGARQRIGLAAGAMALALLTAVFGAERVAAVAVNLTIAVILGFGTLLWLADKFPTVARRCGMMAYAYYRDDESAVPFVWQDGTPEHLEWGTRPSGCGTRGRGRARRAGPPGTWWRQTERGRHFWRPPSICAS